jgi:hypothetical protein
VATLARRQANAGGRHSRREKTEEFHAETVTCASRGIEIALTGISRDLHDCYRRDAG